MNVDKTDTCWLWTGTTTGGYGMTGGMGAHRFAWQLMRGPIRDGYVIDHDNPEYGCGNTLCVNPAHLEPVPISVNVRRGRGLRRSNTSGVRGVHWRAGARKWRVKAIYEGRTYYGGHFDDLAEAEAAAIALRHRLYNTQKG